VIAIINHRTTKIEAARNKLTYVFLKKLNFSILLIVNISKIIRVKGTNVIIFCGVFSLINNDEVPYPVEEPLVEISSV